MFRNDAPLTVQRFGNNILLPEFPCAVSFNLLKTHSLFRRVFDYFFYKIKIIEYSIFLSLFNSNAASRVPLIIFIVLMVSPTAN